MNRMAVPDPLASETAPQANWLREFRRQWHRDGQHGGDMTSCMEGSCLALFAAEGAATAPLASDTEQEDYNVRFGQLRKSFDGSSKEMVIGFALQAIYELDQIRKAAPLASSSAPQRGPRCRDCADGNGTCWMDGSPCDSSRPVRASRADNRADEEATSHPFRPRYQPGGDWCVDCEYHRDHQVHAAVRASGEPQKDTR